MGCTEPPSLWEHILWEHILAFLSIPAALSDTWINHCWSHRTTSEQPHVSGGWSEQGQGAETAPPLSCARATLLKRGSNFFTPPPVPPVHTASISSAHVLRPRKQSFHAPEGASDEQRGIRGKLHVPSLWEWLDASQSYPGRASGMTQYNVTFYVHLKIQQSQLGVSLNCIISPSQIRPMLFLPDRAWRNLT